MSIVGEWPHLLRQPDGTSHRPAELVVTQWRLGQMVAIVGPSRRVEGIVSQELEHGATELVGAGLGDEIDRAAARHAEFGGERVGLHAKFLHRVDVGHNRVFVALRQRRRSAVHQHGIRSALAAVDADARQVEIARVEEGRCQKCDARGQPRQFERVAAIQRQLANARVVDHVTERRPARINKRDAYLHRHRYATDVEGEIQLHGLLHCEDETGPCLGAKARQFCRDRVASRRQQRNLV